MKFDCVIAIKVLRSTMNGKRSRHFGRDNLDGSVIILCVDDVYLNTNPLTFQSDSIGERKKNQRKTKNTGSH